MYYWISDLPADTRLGTLVRLAKIRWCIEHDYRELKTGLRLSHFEGLTFTGWPRHVTLVTAAHLFITRLRLPDPKAPGAASGERIPLDGRIRTGESAVDLALVTGEPIPAERGPCRNQ